MRALTAAASEVSSMPEVSSMDHAMDFATPYGMPQAQGLYDPRNEHDACGVGFVANMHNAKSHDLVRMGLQILLNLDHRGAVGADPKAGDGCGMLMQIPHRFFAEEAARLGFSLPEPGLYAAGALFLPRDPAGRKIAEEAFERIIAEQGQKLLGWRDVPVDPSGLGETVKPTEPVHRQIFIGRGADTPDRGILRAPAVPDPQARLQRHLRAQGRAHQGVVSRLLVLAHHRLQGPLARDAARRLFPGFARRARRNRRRPVHQRFSTNTFPSWRSPIPIAWWPITARSTRCAAM